MILSATEQWTGDYIDLGDGKEKIYTKIVTGELTPSSANVSYFNGVVQNWKRTIDVNVMIHNGERIVPYIENASTNNFNPAATYNAATLNNGNLMIMCGSSVPFKDFYAILKYTKTVEDEDPEPVNSISKIDIDGIIYEFGSNKIVDLTDMFSTAEVVTNRIWIDGRKIYRKVLKGKTQAPGIQIIPSAVDGTIIYAQGWAVVSNTGYIYMSGALIGTNDDYFALGFKNNELVYAINQAVFNNGEYTFIVYYVK